MLCKWSKKDDREKIVLGHSKTQVTYVRVKFSYDMGNIKKPGTEGPQERVECKSWDLLSKIYVWEFWY